MTSKKISCNRPVESCLLPNSVQLCGMPFCEKVIYLYIGENVAWGQKVPGRVERLTSSAQAKRAVHVSILPAPREHTSCCKAGRRSAPGEWWFCVPGVKWKRNLDGILSVLKHHRMYEEEAHVSLRHSAGFWFVRGREVWLWIQNTVAVTWHQPLFSACDRSLWLLQQQSRGWFHVKWEYSGEDVTGLCEFLGHDVLSIRNPCILCQHRHR